MKIIFLDVKELDKLIKRDLMIYFFKIKSNRKIILESQVEEVYIKEIILLCRRTDIVAEIRLRWVAISMIS